MRANIWYEKATSVEPGSGLESIFYYLWQMRERRQFLESQLLIEAVMLAPLQTVEGANPDSKKLVDLNKQYFAACFPYAKAQEEEDTSKRQEVLNRWVERIAAIKVQEVYQDPSTAIREHRRDQRRQQAQETKAHYSKLWSQRGLR